MLFTIYTGLEGEGSEDIGVYEFKNSDEALDFAYDTAVELYQSKQGSLNYPDWDRCRAILEELFSTVTEQDVESFYWENVDSLIVFDAIPKESNI